MDISLIPATVPPTTHVAVADCRVSCFILVLLTIKFIVTIDVDIGIITATLPPITHVGMVYCCITLLLHVLLEKVLVVIG